MNLHNSDGQRCYATSVAYGDRSSKLGEAQALQQGALTVAPLVAKTNGHSV